MGFEKRLRAPVGGPVAVIRSIRPSTTRRYSVNGEHRTLALLRPLADNSASDRIREFVLQAYAECEETATQPRRSG